MSSKFAKIWRILIDTNSFLTLGKQEVMYSCSCCRGDVNDKYYSCHNSNEILSDDQPMGAFPMHSLRLSAEPEASLSS